MVSYSEKPREVEQKALHKKTKGIRTTGPAEQKVTSKKALRVACSANGRGGGVWDCPPATEGGFAGFQGSVSVLVFSCKPSLPFKGQKKLLIDHQ